MMPQHKKRILMLSFELPPYNSGGLGEACLGLTKALSLKNDITFLLPKKLPYPHQHIKLIYADEIEGKQNENRSNKNSIKKNSIKKNYLKNIMDLYSPVLSPYEQRELQKVEEINFDLLQNQHLKRALKEDFDLIHAHDWMTFEVAVQIKRESKKPLIVHVHSTEIDRSPINSLDIHKYKLEKYGMDNADLVVTVSNYTKNIINKYYNIPLNKIKVVYNASNLTKNEQAPKLKVNRPIILFLGRITHQKGPNQFLETAEKVVQELPNVLFVVAGNGDMYEEMIENAAKRGLSGSIAFTGFIRGEYREAVLNSANLFIMPSLSEPFGIVALEAAHYGMPVIVSKQSGVKELLSSAMAVDFWDTDLTAKEIVKVLKNKKLSTEVVKASQIDLKKITWESAAEQCEDVYSEIIKLKQ